ncbi:MAG: hypothetical protein UY92_C0009G0066 [Candidatus Magasanikbacteria bacterium GW2011_GWA2_56_11]|uniref:Transglutaminase-like domain-containing protein n=1 Tax=Candidatus Magasanikbacteria bacterium GW2011_GWA2_56_11 TaxID=1619044 RepID=A0A0G2ALS2_9BACT|nr:MAG: hypothetical protein UY92_C0009G0066 [Candidatus Magasanikbacteria bacterium GW2011_GWA2_56_11]
MAWPEQLKFMGESERKSLFFQILETMSDNIIDQQLARRPYAPPSKPNLCGYAATAVAEGLRRRGIDARVVYGHAQRGDKTVYHYWTEARLDEKPWEIDGTYGQFNPEAQGKILVYPVENLSSYNLREHHEDDEAILPTDGTPRFLNGNEGLLPMREHITEDQLRGLYEELVRVFS